MDPVSTVASIVAIIGFAGTALKAISDLKGFCHEFSPDATRDFLHDLEVTAKVLTDVQTLSEKVKWASPTLHIEYRAEALGIQVDDCSRDLTKWLEIGLRIKERRAGKKQSFKMQFFNSILTAISTASRASAREKLRWHQENINTTLSLLGRHINLANSVTLHNVDQTVHKISRQMSENAEELSKQVSSLSNSISSSAGSLEARNSSMSDKLDLVTDLLQQVISSNQSQTSSMRSSDNSEPHKRSKSTTAETQKVDVKADTSYTRDGNTRLERLKYPDWGTNHSWVSDENPGHAAEFDTLFRATKFLVNSFHQIYHPLIAEFLSTMHAFDTLQLQFRCLHMEPLGGTWTSAYDRSAGLHEATQMEKAAAFQLLSLRKRCIFEGLGDTLELVMSETGVSERDFENWESLTIQGPIGQQRLQLGEHKDLDPGEQRQDRITWINEWMLGVFLASKHSFHLHRRIMDLELKKWRESASPSHIHNWEEHIYGGNAYEAARRTIVKFWFLDSAAMSEEEYASSHFVGSDSDATFRMLEEEDESPDDVTSQSHEAEPKMTMSKTTAPTLNFSSDHPQGMNLGGMDQVLSLEEIPSELLGDGISRKTLAAARKAVADYSQGPCRV